MTSTTMTPVLIALGLLAQATEKPTRDESALRLDSMKAAAASYRLTLGRDAPAVLKLQTDPVFRLGDQGDGLLKDGAIFLWADEIGRPEAAAQVFLLKIANPPGTIWMHEFTTLATEPLTAEQAGSPRWQPTVAGVRFEPIPGAPKAADKPQERLRQMRTLAAEFRAEDDFYTRGWSALRLLPTPISRYGKPGATPEDGALFAFALATDPEAFLFIEVRRGDSGPEWQYAFAPMTCWAVRAEHKGRAVWSLPRRVTDDATKPFFDRAVSP